MSSATYKSIVVGTDGSETAQRAVGEATMLAKALGSVLHVVSAYEPVHGTRVATPAGAPEITSLPSDARARTVVDEAGSGARASGVEVQLHTVTSDPADALLEVAEQEDADLIVVGSRGMHGVKRVLGSVPNKVSHRARRSVLIVGTEDRDS